MRTHTEGEIMTFIYNKGQRSGIKITAKVIKQLHNSGITLF